MAKRPVKAIGVDIGSSAIKMAEATRIGDQYTIERAAIYELDEDVWKDGIPDDLEVAKIHLQRALKMFGSSTKNIVMSVPTSALVVRNEVLDAALRGDELWNTIEANLPQYMPFTSEEVMLDFQIMGPTEGVSGSNDVLITAVQKDYVNLRDLVTEMAGYKLTLLDGDIYALLRLIGLKEPLESYSNYDGIALIEIGLYRTGFHVVLGNGVIYVREFPIGGERLTEIISDLGNLSLGEAEERKINGDWSNDPILQEAHLRFTDEIGEQALSALEVYLPNNPQVELRRIFVTGGSANIPGLVSALSEKFNEELVGLNPLDYVDFSDQVMKKSPASLSIACGLAIRSLD